MTTTGISSFASGNIITRQTFVLILHAALDGKAYRFARQSAAYWLALYPGDLGVAFLLARAHIGDNHDEQAAPILRKLVKLDPEFAEAWVQLAALEKRLGEPASIANACAYALGKETSDVFSLPDWSRHLRQAINRMGQGQYEEAEQIIHRVIGMSMDLPLAAVIHLRLTGARKDAATVFRLSSLYHARWGECLQFALALASSQLAMKDEPESVGLLHHCVSNDAQGQVPMRLWGRNHRFKTLWDENLEIKFDIPIPSDVARRLGWNQLNAGGLIIESQPEVEELPLAHQPVMKDEAIETGLGDSAESGLPMALDFLDGAPSAYDEGAMTDQPVDEGLWGIDSLHPDTGEFGSQMGFAAEPQAVTGETVQSPVEAPTTTNAPAQAQIFQESTSQQEPGVNMGRETSGEPLAMEALETVQNVVDFLKDRINTLLSSQEDPHTVNQVATSEGEPVQTSETVEHVVAEQSGLDSEGSIASGEVREEAQGSEGKRNELPPRRSKKRDGNLRQVEEEFARLAKKMKRPSLSRSDGRFPIYVIFSTHTGLTRQYGAQTAGLIENEMRLLQELVQQRPGWGAMVFLPDSLDGNQRMGVPMVDAIDPWKLKLALADLDVMLGKRGSMIGAVLIVGGPEVVPFHRLPNPTDDADREIYSDNPYATLDSNYFVPEWPVGRLPGEHGPDAGLLLEQIRRTRDYHTGYHHEETWWKQILYMLNSFWNFKTGKKSNGKKNYTGSFGYSAAVWRRSSLAVFRPVGEGRSLLVSPPEYSGSFTNRKITDTAISYYNLHGLEDSADWYGQRDMAESTTGPDYPIALSPKDLVKNGKSPAVVFTEACYGAHIINKSEDQAMSLRFLSIGTQAVAGSTGIAYGSVNTPLIGADLLGYLFWKNLREGYTVGESLMKAKADLAKEMNRRQGFLDGEDQKTLISFVLYGDPLIYFNWGGAKPKTVQRSADHAAFKTICDRNNGVDFPPGVSREMLREVKQMVEGYLPGLDEASVVISQEHEVCDGEHHRCPTSEIGSKVPTYNTAGRVVVTISKQVQLPNHTHRHYARATVDANGKVVKLAVSR